MAKHLQVNEIVKLKSEYVGKRGIEARDGCAVLTEGEWQTKELRVLSLPECVREAYDGRKNYGGIPKTFVERVDGGKFWGGFNQVYVCRRWLKRVDD